jgi:hypothetical protein
MLHLKIVLPDGPAEIAPSSYANPDPGFSSQCSNLKFHQWFHEFALAIDERPFL